MTESIEKVIVAGWDCAVASLTFEDWVDDLPTVRRLMQSGTYGTLESCVPPVTVPAWSCMAASKDPGTLGIYGFRNRADHSYDKLTIATSLAVKEPRIWDILARHDKRSTVVGLPGTYPITRPVHGHMITSFLTPDPASCEYTWPRELKSRIAELVGDYLVDVRGFRTDDKPWLLDQVYEMTDKRLKILKHLITDKPWDLFWFVEIGLDRMHHGFWACMDPSHRRYEKGNAFETAIHDYLVHLDRQLGELLDRVDLSKTAILVVSDHGAQAMKGGVCFNQWLMNEGYLALKETPTAAGQPFELDQVDWSRTAAWGEGGYFGRFFVNLRGREPEGIVPPDEYESLRDEIVAKLEALPDSTGTPMGTRAYRPQELYRETRGVPPDLVVIFGDLRWRSVGTPGHPDIYTFENDTGPDDANHARHGLYLLNHPSLEARGRVDGPTLYDIAPTILTLLKLPVPDDMQGRSLI
jgi:predicted AlkP superfamily phosphohydrolase/phosphomutase